MKQYGWGMSGATVYVSEVTGARFQGQEKGCRKREGTDREVESRGRVGSLEVYSNEK